MRSCLYIHIVHFKCAKLGPTTVLPGAWLCFKYVSAGRAWSLVTWCISDRGEQEESEEQPGEAVLRRLQSWS